MLIMRCLKDMRCLNMFRRCLQFGADRFYNISQIYFTGIGAIIRLKYTQCQRINYEEFRRISYFEIAKMNFIEICPHMSN